MDHNKIDDLRFVDRYLLGKLPADQALEFEEHFVGCAQCAAELRSTRDFIAGLRLEFLRTGLARHKRREQQAF
jgi:hypothetical protein